jgi:uncharacterized membrane protein/uncharacterized membrane protein YeaQ/YmgE (transglycosylase-associated protein family)
VTPVLTWILSGFSAGFIARLAMRSRREFSIVGDLALGLIGGVAGGWLFRQMGITAPEGDLAHVLIAAFGAVVVTGGLRVVRHLARKGMKTIPAARVMDVDIDKQIQLLSDLERRVLSRVLRRQPTAVLDPVERFQSQLTVGERIADRVAAFGGSWTFISLFIALMVVWVVANQQASRPFDPFPFILLNLVLSCVAALQAPVIMMSQNRQAARDRHEAKSDYEVNLRAEMEIMGLHAKLDAVRDREWLELQRLQFEQLEVLKRIEQRLSGGAEHGAST